MSEFGFESLKKAIKNSAGSSFKAGSDGKTKVLPEGDGENFGFFQIGNPSTPGVKLQFRTNPKKIPGNDFQKNDGFWEELVDLSGSSTTQDFQNYLFKGFEIVDEGGVQMLTLSLSDQNVAELERIIIESTLQDLAANEGSNANAGSAIENPSDGGWLRYFMGTSANVHIRLRFGYNQNINEVWGDNKIDESDPDAKGWKERGSNPDKTVIMTPWLYFMIQDIKTSYSYSNGLTEEIKAFSITNNSINNFRLVQQYAVVRGKATKVMHDLFSNDKDPKTGGSISSAFNKTKTLIEFFYKKDFNDKGTPIKTGDEIDEFKVGYVDRKGNQLKEEQYPDIEVGLGHQPTTNKNGIYQLEYKTLNEILNDFCLRAPKKNLKEGRSSPVPSIIDLEPSSTDTSGTAPSDSEAAQDASYYSIPLKWQSFFDAATGSTKVFFFYPETNKQIKIRQYNFYGTGTNLIKNINIDGMISMWALLNMPVIYRSSSGDVTLKLSGQMNTEYTNKRNQRNKQRRLRCF